MLVASSVVAFNNSRFTAWHSCDSCTASAFIAGYAGSEGGVVHITGTLYVGEQKEDGTVWAVYVLDADTVQ